MQPKVMILRFFASADRPLRTETTCSFVVSTTRTSIVSMTIYVLTLSYLARRLASMDQLRVSSATTSSNQTIRRKHRLPLNEKPICASPLSMARFVLSATCSCVSGIMGKKTLLTLLPLVLMGLPLPMCLSTAPILSRRTKVQLRSLNAEVLPKVTTITFCRFWLLLWYQQMGKLEIPKTKPFPRMLFRPRCPLLQGQHLHRLIRPRCLVLLLTKNPLRLQPLLLKRPPLRRDWQAEE
mmetsp:Transcript_17602/g.36288  ORF Transcript_17602/g.36288 Transcript_17602/m.36288 type:complete len:238 (+) Transcript_17602:1102-1815(+)